MATKKRSFNFFENSSNKIKKSLHSNLNKSVKFQEHVEIFKFNDCWKLQVQKYPLETEKQKVSFKLFFLEK